MRKNLHAFACIFILGCSPSDEPAPIYDVPEEFQIIIESFIDEAEKRGHNIDISNLIVAYDDSLDQTVCGTCYANANNAKEQKIIYISSSVCWINYNQKEALLFHELGHCYLYREHDNSILPNGDPKSLMIENNISLYSPCGYVFGNTVNCDFTYKREYYLDELFDDSATIPDWGM